MPAAVAAAVVVGATAADGVGAAAEAVAAAGANAGLRLLPPTLVDGLFGACAIRSYHWISRRPIRRAARSYPVEDAVDGFAALKILDGEGDLVDIAAAVLVQLDVAAFDCLVALSPIIPLVGQ